MSLFEFNFNFEVCLWSLNYYYSVKFRQRYSYAFKQFTPTRECINLGAFLSTTALNVIYLNLFLLIFYVCTALVLSISSAILLPLIKDFILNLSKHFKRSKKISNAWDATGLVNAIRGLKHSEISFLRKRDFKIKGRFYFKTGSLKF